MHVSISNVTKSNTRQCRVLTCTFMELVWLGWIRDTSSTYGSGNIGTGLLFLWNSDSCLSSSSQHPVLLIEGSVIEVTTLLHDVLVFSLQIALKNCSIISNQVFSESDSENQIVLLYFALMPLGQLPFMM